MDAMKRRALALGALLLSAGAAAALEAKMYAVTTWNAGCSGGTRDSWDDMVRDWYDDITTAASPTSPRCPSATTTTAWTPATR